MRRLLVILMLSSGFLLAQSGNAPATDQNNNADKSQVTVRGCVDRERGDYILIQQDPAVTWELQGTGKIKINKYFGQRVEVTGAKVNSIPTSSDSMTGSSAPSPVTIMVSSVKVLAKSCAEHQVNH